jgi:uncharacterized protein YciI
MNLYAVTRTHGSTLQKTLPLEAQVDWDIHASFMNALVDEGFVVLGGPLEGTDDVLLIVRASSPDEIAHRLQADPWSTNGLLRLRRIAPWTIRLGSLP